MRIAQTKGFPTKETPDEVGIFLKVEYINIHVRNFIQIIEVSCWLVRSRIKTPFESCLQSIGRNCILLILWLHKADKGADWLLLLL